MQFFGRTKQASRCRVNWSSKFVKILITEWTILNVCIETDYDITNLGGFFFSITKLYWIIIFKQRIQTNLLLFLIFMVSFYKHQHTNLMFCKGCVQNLINLQWNVIIQTSFYFPWIVSCWGHLQLGHPMCNRQVLNSQTYWDNKKTLYSSQVWHQQVEKGFDSCGAVSA